MKTFLTIVFSCLAIFQTCFAPPVTQTKEKHDEADIGGLEDYMEYHRYLREVVNALESDPQFRDKLEKADEKDIRSGKIAEELEFVSHHVRSRLDEIKRVELNRLKDLTEKKIRLQQNIDLEDPTHKHLDHSNPHTFEIDDLKKLIAKTTADLVEADRKRREEFKEYELQKEYEKQLQLNHTNGTEREKLEKELKEREEKHKKHERLHEPGHKAQLEEVWQEQDQMQQEFDPKTFFMLHDIDSNGLWDQDEVKALFVKELEKMYAAGEPEDDMRERAEEMERMRESVFKEVDLNRDGFIDYDEFLAQTKRNDFQQDHGWQGLDERKPYTDQELEEYIRQHQMANQIPHGYPQYPQPGYHHPQQQFHPGAVPQQQYHPGAVPQQQYHPGQVHPQQQMHPGAVPQQMHPGAVPQQQYHPGQVHQQQQMHAGAVPQQQMHPGAAQQQQFHPGQLPQQNPQQLRGQLNSGEVYPHQNQQQQVNYQQQQPPAVHQQQQPPAVNQQPPVVNQQQQQPQAVNQQLNNQPPVVNQQQQQPQVNQQQQPVGNVPPAVPDQANVQQANIANLNKQESPEVNKV